MAGSVTFSVYLLGHQHTAPAPSAVRLAASNRPAFAQAALFTRPGTLPPQSVYMLKVRVREEERSERDADVRTGGGRGDAVADAVSDALAVGDREG